MFNINFEYSIYSMNLTLNKATFKPSITTTKNKVLDYFYAYFIL